jgi:hypothetical protein
VLPLSISVPISSLALPNCLNAQRIEGFQGRNQGVATILRRCANQDAEMQQIQDAKSAQLVV